MAVDREQALVMGLDFGTPSGRPLVVRAEPESRIGRRDEVQTGARTESAGIKSIRIESVTA